MRQSQRISTPFIFKDSFNSRKSSDNDASRRFTSQFKDHSKAQESDKGSSDDDESFLEDDEDQWENQNQRQTQIIPKRTIVTGETLILSLPQHLRVEIWKCVGNKWNRSLRLTCKKIREDIDHHLGISFVVNELLFYIEDVFENIGVRHATIVQLPSVRVTSELLHPELLVELSIHGQISSPFFRYFMKSCQNIHRLSIVYNKPLLKAKPELFPQASITCLPALRALRFVAHTKKEKEIVYICDTVTGLIKETLAYAKEMVDLHFSLSHKGPSLYLQELVLEIIVFAHKNSRTLQEFHLNVKDKDKGSTANSPAGEESEDNPSQRRGTEMVQSNSSMQTTSTDISFLADRKNSEILQQAQAYLKYYKWPRLPHLKKVNVAINSDGYKYLEKMFANAGNLTSFQLEINGGVVLNCWLCYQIIIKNIGHSLTAIKLLGVSYEDFLQNSLDIDFSTFSGCNCLRKLHLSAQPREERQLPRARNLSSLPKTLQELETGWMTISSWQIFKLLYSYPKLDKLSISYSTASDRTFGCFLTIFRWLIILGWTNVQVLIMTDSKIKFRNKRAALKKLKKSVPIQIEYLDREETLLIIDRGKGRTSLTSIPSIASE